MNSKECIYIDCGLDNVIVKNVSFVVDDAGNSVYEIPNVFGLHKAISIAILLQNRHLRPKEIKFLRTECGWTQGDLANLINRDSQTVGRWERGDTSSGSIDQNCDVLMRLLFAEALEIDLDAPITDMIKSCGPTLDMEFLEIEGADPTNYRPIVQHQKLAAVGRNVAA